MAKRIIIAIAHPAVRVILKDEKQFIDEIVWQDSGNFSLELLLNIDKLLQRHNLTVQDLQEIELKSNQTGYTSSRIAQTVRETLNYCLTKSKEPI